MRLAVYALLTAISILSPSPAFSKGKKPPPPATEEESEMQEEEAVEEESLSVESPAGKRAQESFKEDMESEAPEEPEAVTQQPVPPEAVADEPRAQAPAGSKVHIVWVWQESRDCLWKLAEQYYSDPWQWKKIYQENRNSILDPGIIYPKQRIIIPPSRAQ